MSRIKSVPTRWAIGSRAVTKGGRFPLLNAGKLVTVVWYDPSRHDRSGKWVPFKVQRIDGEAFAVSTSMETGRFSYCGHTTVWISEDNLEFLPDLVEETDVGLELREGATA